MAQTSTVEPVKLFIITLHRNVEILENVIAKLRSVWGETDFISEDFPFDATRYYENEMGPGLLRRFLSFQTLIQPDQLVDVKLYTNRLEQENLSGPSRRINVDPGTIDQYKVVLASAKFGGQKIYLRDGIYADMTLVMYKGKWESFAWGFPDFKSGKYDAVLSQIRDLYKKQIRVASR
jgi:hypothetical protein